MRQMNSPARTDTPVIFAYTRQQAITDGVLVDVSRTASEAGFRYPVALTRTVWERFVRVPEACPWQDESGRLWDILWMLRWAGSQSGQDGRLNRFSLVVENDGEGSRPVELKAHCGPGDHAEPVITVMLPEED